MRTVSETALFQKKAAALWSEDEYDAFIEWIAKNPLAGDVIPQGHGVRKVRWSRSGTGKSGGVRVIYLHLSKDEQVLLLTMYAKSEMENLPPAALNQLMRN